MWGGSRRLAVRVEAVQARQEDREERVLGPPVKAAFDGDGKPTRAAVGFAGKLGVEPSALGRFETDRGVYVGLERTVPGRTVGELLAAELPEAVSGMWFPKTMRWAGRSDTAGSARCTGCSRSTATRWCRCELFDVRFRGTRSLGHRFLALGCGPSFKDADRYEEALAAKRRSSSIRLYGAEEPDARSSLDRVGGSGTGASRLLEDRGLLEETADLDRVARRRSAGTVDPRNS